MVIYGHLFLPSLSSGFVLSTEQPDLTQELGLMCKLSSPRDCVSVADPGRRS